MALKRAGLGYKLGNLFGGSVLGDSFGTFRDSMLSKFTWKEKSARVTYKNVDFFVSRF